MATMVRSAVLITAMLACFAMGWFAIEKGLVDSASTQARRLRGEPEQTLTLVAPSVPEAAPIVQLAEAHFVIFGWFQFVILVVFYFTVVRKYPKLGASNAASAAIMEESTVCRINVGTTCFQAWCCSGVMLAHVMHNTGKLNYWLAAVLGAACPFCTVLGATHFLETDASLGGKDKGFLPHLFEAFFCSCCVIAQSSEALDAATGAELGLVNIKSGAQAREIASSYQVMPDNGQAA